MSTNARAWAAGVAGLATLFVAGCATIANEQDLTTDADAYVEAKPEQLRRFYHALYLEGEWNAVLNFDLLGLAAMEIGRFDIAREAFDQASVRILGVYSDDPNARKAKSLWSKEEVKSFKGEPYERAMSFYYGGLVYLAQGDYENARASFLQADFQNSLAFGERYGSTFSLAKYLAAWASSCDGDDAIAEGLLDETRDAVEPYFASHGPDFPRSLVIGEYGLGPDKVTYGKSRNLLGFWPEVDVTGQHRFRYPGTGTPRSEGLAANLDYMALTRDGRPIDSVLDGKAQFKETTGTIAGAGGRVSGAVFESISLLGPDQMENMEILGQIGVASSLVSAISGGLSKKTEAGADTRVWASLPKAIVVEGFRRPGVYASGLVTQSGSRVRKPSIRVTHGPCSLTWVREYSGLDRADGGTGNPSPWPARPREQDREGINEAFRVYLKRDMP